MFGVPVAPVPAALKHSFTVYPFFGKQLSTPTEGTT